MITEEHKTIYIYGVAFIVVTNETTSGNIMNYEEAKHYAKTGQRIACSSCSNIKRSENINYKSDNMIS